MTKCARGHVGTTWGNANEWQIESGGAEQPGRLRRRGTGGQRQRHVDASAGGGNIDLGLAAAGNTEVIRAKRKVMANLGVRDALEDVLISLGNQYHLLRPLESNPELFLYVVLDRSKANLALARHELKAFEKTLDFS